MRSGRCRIQRLRDCVRRRPPGNCPSGRAFRGCFPVMGSASLLSDRYLVVYRVNAAAIVMWVALDGLICIG